MLNLKLGVLGCCAQVWKQYMFAHLKNQLQPWVGNGLEIQLYRVEQTGSSTVIDNTFLLNRHWLLLYTLYDHNMLPCSVQGSYKQFYRQYLHY